jgi:hypothetical protein
MNGRQRTHCVNCGYLLRHDDPRTSDAPDATDARAFHVCPDGPVFHPQSCAACAWENERNLPKQDMRRRTAEATVDRTGFLYGYAAACKAHGVPYDCASAEDAYKSATGESR